MFRQFQISLKWSIWGVLLLELKQWALGTPYHIVKGSNMLCALIQSQINQLSMICYRLRWVGQHFIQKRKVLTHYMTKHHYSNKENSISLFVSHAPQIPTTSVSMVQFKSRGHVCAIQYLKPTVLAFSVFPDQSKTVSLGFILLELQYWGLGTPYSIVKGLNIFKALIQGDIN